MYICLQLQEPKWTAQLENWRQCCLGEIRMMLPDAICFFAYPLTDGCPPKFNVMFSEGDSCEAGPFHWYALLFAVNGCQSGFLSQRSENNGSSSSGRRTLVVSIFLFEWSTRVE